LGIEIAKASKNTIIRLIKKIRRAKPWNDPWKGVPTFFCFFSCTCRPKKIADRLLLADSKARLKNLLSVWQHKMALQ